MKTIILMLVFLLAGTAAFADEADVMSVDVVTQGDTYIFTVTVWHADTGWGHYADRWEVLAPDGTILGTRPILHPHVDEQPFTRKLSGVIIPKGITTVTVQAHDSVHGYGGRTMTVDLP